MKVKSANVFKKGEYKMKKNFLLALAAVAAISFNVSEIFLLSSPGDNSSTPSFNASTLPVNSSNLTSDVSATDHFNLVLVELYGSY